MRKFISMVSVAAAATVFGATGANANVTCTPGICSSNKASFVVTPDNVGPNYKGPISASIGDTFIAAGTFTDTFNFILPQSGIGSGAITTIATAFHNTTDLDFTSVLINNVAATLSPKGVFETAYVSSTAVSAGPNSITVMGVSRGSGGYGGNISFTTAVPELATWGMMILGFAAMGAAMRYRRRSTQVSFA